MKNLFLLAFGWVSLVFNQVLAQYEVTLQEPIGGVGAVSGSHGFALASQYLNAWYGYIAGIAGIICVCYIVYSGIQITMGGANSELVNQAKNRIMQSLLSLAVILGLALLLRTINPFI